MSTEAPSTPTPDQAAHAACLAVVTAAAAYRRLHGLVGDTPYVRITEARRQLFDRVDDLLLTIPGHELPPDLKLTTTEAEPAA